MTIVLYDWCVLNNLLMFFLNVKQINIVKIIVVNIITLVLLKKKFQRYEENNIKCAYYRRPKSWLLQNFEYFFFNLG